MITDYSSIFIDFLLTKKPIIFYLYDLNQYLEKNRKMYFNYNDIILKKLVIKKEDDLIKILELIFYNKLDFLDNNYYKILNLFHKNQNWWYIKNIINKIKI